MRLGEQPSELEPVMFDVQTIDEKRREASINSVFRFGWASFDNPIYDAVARSSGISEDGVLDMDMVEAAQQVADYVDGKHGQPLVLLDIARTPESDKDFAYMAGFFGRLALDGPLFGVFGDHQGIAIVGEHTEPHLYTDTGGRYQAQYLSKATGPTIPLRTSRFTLGVPGDTERLETEQTEYAYQQDLVVGEDILPWIETTFAEQDRYNFYTDLVGCLVRNACEERMRWSTDWSLLDSLIAEPYLQLAKEDIVVLQELSKAISQYEFNTTNAQKLLEGYDAQRNLELMSAETHKSSIENARRVLDGYVAQSNLELVALAEAHPEHVRRLHPGTFSNSSGASAAQRRKNIEWYRYPLEVLTYRADQLKHSRA